MRNSYGRRKGISLVEIFIGIIVLGIIGAVGGGIFACCYGYLNAKTVEGTVESIQNLTPAGVYGGTGTDKTVTYSFAVSIETDEEIFGFSAEDRQWGTVKVGDKVKAKVFPYAPWNFGKSGTYYGGRLLKKYKK